MTLSNSIADQIEADMCDWLDNILEKKKSEYAKASTDVKHVEPIGQTKPFHKALLPKSFTRMSSFERSFSTLLGKSHERHSAIIAKSRFAKTELQHKTEGTIHESVDTEISDEVERINKGHMFSNYFDVVEKIVNMEERGSGNRVSRSVNSDLYLKSHDGDEIFFEIKTSKPSKEQCLNITRKHLWIHAVRKLVHPKVKTYFAMAYNPYGEENEYRHSFAKKHLDIERQTLIGKQYWDYLGGEGTYEDLLNVYRRVGITKSKEINKILEI